MTNQEILTDIQEMKTANLLKNMPPKPKTATEYARQAIKDGCDSQDRLYELLVSRSGLYGKAFFGFRATPKERHRLNYLWKVARTALGAKTVLQLMDKDWSYQTAVNFLVDVYKYDRNALERELNYYI